MSKFHSSIWKTDFEGANSKVKLLTLPLDVVVEDFANLKIVMGQLPHSSNVTTILNVLANLDPDRPLDFYVS